MSGDVEKKGDVRSVWDYDERLTPFFVSDKPNQEEPHITITISRIKLASGAIQNQKNTDKSRILPDFTM